MVLHSFIRIICFTNSRLPEVLVNWYEWNCHGRWKLLSGVIQHHSKEIAYYEMRILYKSRTTGEKQNIDKQIYGLAVLCIARINIFNSISVFNLSHSVSSIIYIAVYRKQLPAKAMLYRPTMLLLKHNMAHHITDNGSGQGPVEGFNNTKNMSH